MPMALLAVNEAALPVHVLSLAPFVLLLLAIAVLPLAAGHFWHSNLRKALVAVGLALPAAGYLFYLDLAQQQPGIERLEHALLEYLNFIVLLFSLYAVAGGIVVEGNFRPTPLVNSSFLLVGAVLANFIGTTGASMVLIRPVLRINQTRQHRGHIPVFFIFLVSNLGGLLTPLGDPPLFLGFGRGVDFLWTLRLWPHWLLANGAVLFVFLLWDSWAYRREGVLETAAAAPLRVRGLVNILLLAGVLFGVLLQQKVLHDEATNLIRELWQDAPVLLWGTCFMALMALLSLMLTPRGLRQQNQFTWEAIVEVAVLFLGIFVTMVPALEYLQGHKDDLGVTEPWQYFWFTGALSSFLDNAPTYLTFGTIAAGGPDLGALSRAQPLLLEAVSCGAVFMGANTYIGNGPNFMVKAIAESAGYRTPSFFGYMAYSSLILLPVFGVATWVFFR